MTEIIKKCEEIAENAKEYIKNVASRVELVKLVKDYQPQQTEKTEETEGSTGCKEVFISDKAHISIIAETASRDPDETGGVFFGQIGDDNNWYVMEATDPGIKTFHSVVHHEMDDKYHNHIYPVITRIYKNEPELLGLWHRHPGSVDTFSQDDNNTNREYAKVIGRGAISLLVNIDPQVRYTCYYLDMQGVYHKVPVKVGDKYFRDKDYFRLASPESLWKNKRNLNRDINRAN